VSLSDRLEQESVISGVVLFLESKAHLIIGQSGWDSRGKVLSIDPSLLSDMNKYRKYDTHCVRDLLRVIRNKKHHFHELSSDLRAKLKLDLPVGFLAYFENRFPRLLLRAVETACTFFSDEKDFAPLCRAIAPILRGGDAAETSSSSSTSLSISTPLPSSTPTLQSIINTTSSATATSTSATTSASISPTPYGTPARTIVLLTPPVDIVSVVIAGAGTLDSAFLESPVPVPVAPVIDPLNVVVWHGGALSVSLSSRGWWRKIDQCDSWSGSGGAGAGTGGGGGGGGWSSAKAGRPRPMHLIRASTDLKYRTRLCTHWEQTVTCPMRKKGKRMRERESKRERE
jgi:Ribonuclease 2-5A